MGLDQEAVNGFEITAGFLRLNFPKESALNLERKSHKLLSGEMDFLYSFHFGVKNDVWQR